MNANDYWQQAVQLFEQYYDQYQQSSAAPYTTQIVLGAATVVLFLLWRGAVGKVKLLRAVNHVLARDVKNQINVNQLLDKIYASTDAAMSGVLQFTRIAHKTQNQTINDILQQLTDAAAVQRDE